MNSTKGIISKGVFYTALSRYSNVLITILITAILARLLTPFEFGVVAVVMVFTTFFNVLGDFGIGPAVIQFKNLTEKDLQSIFSFSVIVSIALASIFFLSNHLVASFYEDEKLKDIIKLLSISVLFFSMSVVPKALLFKKLKFKQVGILNVAIQLCSGTVAIILAYFEYSYFSLIVKSILDGLLSFIIFFSLSFVKPTLRIKWISIEKIIGFSSYQFMFNFINYFSRNTDNLLISKYFGPALLGYYDKAYRLMMMPVQNLTHVITPTLQPILSEFQDDHDKIFVSYLKVVKVLALIGFPLSFFLFYSSTEIVYIIFGSQWDASVPIFKLLALTVGLQMVLSSSGAIFQSIDRTDLLFVSGLISSFFMVSGICYGIFLGRSLEHVGLGLIFAFGLNFIQSFYFLIVRGLKKPLIKFFKILMVPIGTSCILGLVLCFVSYYRRDNMFLNLLINLIVFLILFLISQEHRKIFSDLIRDFKKG